MYMEPKLKVCIPLQIGRLLENLPDSNGTRSVVDQGVVDMIRNVSTVLEDKTDPEERTRPLFPRDLNTTNNFLDIVSL